LTITSTSPVGRQVLTARLDQSAVLPLLGQRAPRLV
jgi:hypothetical protein